MASPSPIPSCETIQDATCAAGNTTLAVVEWAGPFVVAAWLIFFGALVALGFWYGVRWERRRASRG